MKRYTELLRLGAPILVGQLGMIIVGFADNIMVGHYSTEALASASFVNNVFNVAILCSIGFTYGLTPLIGAMYGRDDTASIGRTLRNAVWLNTLFTLGVMAVMTVIYFNLHRLGQPEELLPLIRPYYLIYLAGMLPISLFNVFAQWSYAIRNTRLPMWIVLGANLLNVAGNYVLIYGKFGLPELGLTGAGLSTLLARVVCPAAIIGVFVFSGVYRRYRQAYAAARTDTSTWGVIWRTSIPVAGQMSFETGSFTAAAVMCGWLGAVPLAAFQIIVVTGTLGFCVYYSIGAAVAVLVSNAAGTGDTKAMRRVAWSGYHILLALMVVASLIFIFGGRVLMGAFTTDDAVLTLAVSLIFPMVLYQVADATQICFANALRGTSHVMPMLWVSALAYLVVGVPATYLLGFTAGLGTYGIVLSFSVSLLCAAVGFLYFFLKVTRRRL